MRIAGSLAICVSLFLMTLLVANAATSTVVVGGSELFTPRYLPNIVQSAKGPADMIFFVYKYLMGLVGIVAVGTIIYAGVLYTISADPSKIKQSNEYIRNALKGIVLLFGAQVLFNTINPNIVNFPQIQSALQPKEKFAPNAFNGTDIELPKDASTTPGGSAQSAVNLYGGSKPVCASATTNGVRNVYPNCGPDGTVDLATKIKPCNDCVASKGNSFAVAGDACFGIERNQGCLENKALVDTLNKLQTITSGTGVTWQMNGGYPPSVNHQSSCHWDGTCVDINLGFGTAKTAANVDKLITAMQQAGLTVVNEYGVGTVVKPTSYSTKTGGNLHVHL